jgi:large subunit ribosomal protein L34e
MPRLNKRSRTFRRIYVKTPSGKNVISYRRRKPSKSHCANCGKLLQGIPRELPYKMKNMPKSQKRPERIFGGKLCSNCTKRELIRRIRK